jgi:hypothetical protein
MNVQPGYYRLSTLNMMMADINRTDARAMIPGQSVNGVPVEACSDPIINCTSGTVTLSNEADYVIPDSSYYDGGMAIVVTRIALADPANLYMDGVED